MTAGNCGYQDTNQTRLPFPVKAIIATECQKFYSVLRRFIEPRGICNKSDSTPGFSRERGCRKTS